MNFIPLSYRQNRWGRFRWWVKGQRERLALWLAPWLELKLDDDAEVGGGDDVIGEFPPERAASSKTSVATDLSAKSHQCVVGNALGHPYYPK